MGIKDRLYSIIFNDRMADINPTTMGASPCGFHAVEVIKVDQGIQSLPSHLGVVDRSWNYSPRRKSGVTHYEIELQLKKAGLVCTHTLLNNGGEPNLNDTLLPHERKTTTYVDTRDELNKPVPSGESQLLVWNGYGGDESHVEARGHHFTNEERIRFWQETYKSPPSSIWTIRKKQ